MNDKERLRRLKRLNNLSNVWEYLEQTTLYGGNALKESWEWLISQAEKAEQLQQENERLKKNIIENYVPMQNLKVLDAQLHQAQDKVERYEKALKEIAVYCDTAPFNYIAKQALEEDNHATD
jgi:hypothetical protein